MKVTLILACAGKGERCGYGKNKLLAKFNGKTTLERTLEKFTSSSLIDEYVVVVSKEDEKEVRQLLNQDIKIVIGGTTRTQSVRNALDEVDDGIVLIHDGARPFVSKRIIADCIDSATKFGSGVTAIKNIDTLLTEKSGGIDYVGKEGYYLVQTPQAFDVKKIKQAYSANQDKAFNDDGEVYLCTFNQLNIVEGDKDNIKLTYKEDFDKLLLIGEVKIGTGFDCHKLVEGRKLILGGIQIPHDKGLLGHSDADVLTHAIMDAILSAISQRDIGYHFPDSDAKYKDADSVKLLKTVLQMVEEKGYKINNVSAVIMAEKPKLLKYIPIIASNLANVMGISSNDIGITATTLEGLGFVGREKGICVNACVSIKKHLTSR